MPKIIKLTDQLILYLSAKWSQCSYLIIRVTSNRATMTVFITVQLSTFWPQSQCMPSHCHTV